MPNKPNIVTLTNSSVDVFNAIRNNASTDFKDYVPYATPNADSAREIGAILADNITLMNEFIHALVNRIGRVIVTSKTYSNPWAMFKKGVLEFGDTVEEIFVNIANVHTYDAETAESELYKREIPDVKSAFHIMNYQKFYKATIQQKDLRKAFLSWGGVSDLIGRIFDSMLTASNYDEYQTMKYLLARYVLNGKAKVIGLGLTGNEDASEVAKIFVSKTKETSNNFEFLSNKYNAMGVMNLSMKNDQYIIIDSEVDAKTDVYALASAFNMDKTNFVGHKVVFDGFANIDNDRLDMLFNAVNGVGDCNYRTLTATELTQLATVKGILLDREFFMIFDNLIEMNEKYNEQGLYWNHWYHAWKTFSVSPFANSAVFTSATPSVSTVDVTPSTVTASAGSTVLLKADVTATGFASKEVAWTLSTGAKANVSDSGVVTIDADATGTITVTATAKGDSTKTDTCVITVA